MVGLDEMNSLIQEWMAQPLTKVELAKLYAELRMELDKQLEYMMNAIYEDKTSKE